MKYSIEVEEGPNDTNSGSFLTKAGHVRNQYFWHPFFGFNSAGDLADFSIEVRIPSEYHVSTSLPQTERIEGRERVIRGQTTRPTFALTLIYDRDWKVTSESFGPMRLELFLTPQFQPNAEAVGREFRAVHELLSQRFGAPRSNYFGVVEARSKEGNGWHFASNDIVVAAGWPRIMSSGGNRPRAYLGHEIGHLWTAGSGPASNFLQEGWATFAESVILEMQFGAGAVKAFWKNQADNYFRQFEGKAGLLDDTENSGVAYSKGSWLFRMLEDAMGRAEFQKGIAEYSRRSLAESSGWETLAECAQRYAPPDFDAHAFLLPWLAGKQAPHLTAETQGRAVTIRQNPPYFLLPVTIEASTAQGVERQRTWIKGAETIVTFTGEPSAVRIDPDESLLLRR